MRRETKKKRLKEPFASTFQCHGEQMNESVCFTHTKSLFSLFLSGGLKICGMYASRPTESRYIGYTIQHNRYAPSLRHRLPLPQSSFMICIHLTLLTYRSSRGVQMIVLFFLFFSEFLAVAFTVSSVLSKKKGERERDFESQ